MRSGSSLLLPRTLDSLYGEFRFDEASHQYWLGEKILPGITGILRATGYVDTSFYTEESRVRGTHVHLAVRFLNKGTLDWGSVLDKYMGYVMAYEKLVEDWNIKVEVSERPMYHPELLYGGTPDIIGTVLDNVPAVIELKTGPVMKWTALQTAAQEMMHRAWEVNPVRRRRWGVTLNADGTYVKPKEFPDWQIDEMVFRTLNSAVQYRELYGA